MHNNKLNELFGELPAKAAIGEITRDEAKAEMIKAEANRDDAEEIFWMRRKGSVS